LFAIELISVGFPQAMKVRYASLTHPTFKYHLFQADLILSVNQVPEAVIAAGGSALASLRIVQLAQETKDELVELLGGLEGEEGR
jgi:hypothetical protein